MNNRLQNETSPYLLQHAGNPVYWYPWGDEAFEKARQEDKPIFLSIGYSTCHWCHVMAHESFEDEKTAEILNKHFISIKVDREERPDIDSVYMSVCQAFTGSGGWPMSIFMSWDKKPFFAGTYFPPRTRYGMPGFPELLHTIAKQWKTGRAELLESAEEVIAHLQNTEPVQDHTDSIRLTKKAVEIFAHSFDHVHGGFGSAPKFPTPHNLLFLMFYAKQNHQPDILKMVEKTLLQMRKGGIFDHIGYGFSRYSTDKYYLAPHFEKMLYDNALLIIAYASAYRLTKRPVYLDTAEKTAEYILKEMSAPDGGFYSAQDADSEGIEGKYYTFSQKEVMEVLGQSQGKRFAEIFDITEKGNFEDVNIPNLLKSNELSSEFEDEIKKLYTYRKDRFKLHLDDKILLSWNSMMITALAVLYRVTCSEKYLDAAEKALQFIENNLCKGLEVYTSFRDEKHSKHGFLDDYAFYITALLEMYNATLEKRFLERAECFCHETVQRFIDHENGGFYLCAADNDELFINPKETYDGAIPSGNSVMAYNLVRLYQLTDKSSYQALVQKQFHFMAAGAHGYPAGYCMFLTAVLMYENPPVHVTVVTNNHLKMTDLQKQLPLLANVSVVTESAEFPLLNGRTTFYICKDQMCLPPVTSLDNLSED